MFTHFYHSIIIINGEVKWIAENINAEIFLICDQVEVSTSFLYTF